MPRSNRNHAQTEITLKQNHAQAESRSSRITLQQNHAQTEITLKQKSRSNRNHAQTEITLKQKSRSSRITLKQNQAAFFFKL
jgi:hypothetical protein